MNVALRMTLAVVAIIAVAGCSGGPGATASAVRAATPTPRPVATASPTPLVAASAAAPLYDPKADARADINAALKAAKGDGKRVLIDFGADWCPDCHVLAAYLDGPAGRALVEPNFHVVRVDVGIWDHNLDVANTYGNPIRIGIPSVVVLDKAGKVIGTTADGSLANARGMSESDVLGIIAAWVP
jgi:thiol:disulfide interchange protein